jgi:hypothetical protein
VNALSAESLSTLTDVEANFVYNAEVLMLPARKAAEMAGLPFSQIYADHIKQARELVKSEVNQAINLTKADVAQGIYDAIGRAKIIGEPMTEIVGWRDLAKLLGHDTPAKVDINITASIDVVRSQLRQLPDHELSELAGANGIIDAEFYMVRDGKA